MAVAHTGVTGVSAPGDEGPPLRDDARRDHSSIAGHGATSTATGGALSDARQLAAPSIAIVGSLAGRAKSLDDFEEFADAMSSPVTVKAAQVCSALRPSSYPTLMRCSLIYHRTDTQQFYIVPPQALLRRLEERLTSARGASYLQSCSQQLRCLFPTHPGYQQQLQQRTGARRRLEHTVPRGGVGGTSQSAPQPPQGSAGSSGRADRFPARVFLSAWMIIRYPAVVFSSAGQREQRLAEAAAALTASFEALLARLVDPSAALGSGATSSLPQAPMLSPSPLATGVMLYRVEQQRPAQIPSLSATMQPSEARSVAELLVHFDRAWVQYLDQFVAWKTEDAQALETELVRALDLYKLVEASHFSHLHVNPWTPWWALSYSIFYASFWTPPRL